MSFRIVRRALSTAVVLLVLASAAAAVPPPRPLRIVSFNLLHGGSLSGWWGDGHRLEERLAMAAEGLRALEADVIGLQEASVGPGRGDTAARLAAELGFHQVFAPVRFDGGARSGAVLSWLAGFDEGPAILSRFPIASSEARPLQPCGERYQRVLLCAELTTPWGPLDVCSTHLSGNSCQAESLSTLLRARRRSVPLVLTGDLNASEDSAGLRLLLRDTGLVDTFRRVNPTAPGLTVWQWVHTAARMARRRVDYVLFGPGPAFAGRVVASRVVLDTPGHTADGGALWPSDHYGVLSEIAAFPPR